MFGEWLSLVEHLVRDQGVGGSNPLSPTIFFNNLQPFSPIKKSNVDDFVAVKASKFNIAALSGLTVVRFKCSLDECSS